MIRGNIKVDVTANTKARLITLTCNTEQHMFMIFSVLQLLILFWRMQQFVV